MIGISALSLPVGIIVATMVSSVGIGGGILWMPFFLIVLKLPPDAAVITSLLIQTAGMGSGGAAFIRRKTADLRLAGFFLLLTLPGLAVGACLTRLVSAANLELVLGILTLTIALVFVSANQPYADRGVDRVSVKQARRYGWIVSSLSIASGMLSVSIGEWLVPLMRHRLKLCMRASVATSIVTIFGTCAFGAGMHMILGARADAKTLIWAVPGVLIGGQVGPRITERINDRRLKEIFIFLLTLIGIHLIYNSY